MEIYARIAECLVRGEIGRNKKKPARECVEAKRNWSLIAPEMLVGEQSGMVQCYTDDTAGI